MSERADGVARPETDAARRSGATQTKRFLRLAARAAAAVALLGAAAWCAGALWFRGPGGAAGAALAGSAAVCLLLAAAEAARGRTRAVLFALPLAAIGVWWSTLEPSNARNWAADVARPPTVAVEGDVATVANVRAFRWRGEDAFDARWDTRRYDLSTLARVDLLTTHWSGESIAHVMVSFGFADGRFLVWSVELRRREGQAYSALASFFRQSELIMVAGTEPDLIGVRAGVRNEDVRLYPLALSPAQARSLFLRYAERANELAATPEWYNALTANCTTVVLELARTLAPDAPYSWQVLLPGHFPDYAYARGAMGTAEPFAAFRARAPVSAKARAAMGAPDIEFSARVRAPSGP